ncbi:DUF3298 and DUF4163 domain-containing protein [Peribacillus sp. SCS-155]|uniref:DUF3298 and DUF4163 domain-containing protein n=1 Tax=Peribacillus sedimenti TaxID=3115297 RepID=UPI0039066C37
MQKLNSFKLQFSILLAFTLFSFLMFSASITHASSPTVKVTSKLYTKKSQTINLVYPQVTGLKSKSAQIKINTALLNHVKKSYKNYLLLKKDMEEVKKEGLCKQNPQFCVYYYGTSFKVKYNNAGKLSILLIDDQYSGGAHGTAYVTGYNFNTSTGDKYSLTSVLNTKTKMNKVWQYTFNYMKKRPNTFFAEDLDKYLRINNNTAFYFTSSGISLLFQQYEVAPYAAGNPEVKIPSNVYR